MDFLVVTVARYCRYNHYTLEFLWVCHLTAFKMKGVIYYSSIWAFNIILAGGCGQKQEDTVRHEMKLRTSASRFPLLQ